MISKDRKLRGMPRRHYSVPESLYGQMQSLAIIS